MRPWRSLAPRAPSPHASSEGLTVEPEGQVLRLHGVVGPHVAQDNGLCAQEVVEGRRVQLAIYRDRGSARPERGGDTPDSGHSPRWEQILGDMPAFSGLGHSPTRRAVWPLAGS